MSIKLMSVVWELDLPHEQILVLLALADHADDDGTRCYPSVPYVAWKTNYSERQVQRVIHALEESRLITPVRHTTGGRGKAVEYHLHLENGDKKAPFERGKRVTNTTRKGDILSVKGDICDRKGDIAMSPQPSVTTREPSKKHQLAAQVNDPVLRTWAEHNSDGRPLTKPQRERLHQCHEQVMAAGKDQAFFSEAVRQALLKASTGHPINYLYVALPHWLVSGLPQDQHPNPSVNSVTSTPTAFGPLAVPPPGLTRDDWDMTLRPAHLRREWAVLSQEERDAVRAWRLDGADSPINREWWNDRDHEQWGIYMGLGLCSVYPSSGGKYQYRSVSESAAVYAAG